MKTRMKQKLEFGWIAAIALAGLVLGATSCSRPKADSKPADVDYYTCTMHPSVKKQNPTDKCPICSMDLTPVKKKSGGASEGGGVEPGASERQSGAASKDAPRSTLPAPDAPYDPNERPSEFNVPVERQQQIGVTYATVEKKPLQLTIRTVGLVAYDKQRHWDYVSRVEGYVKELYVFSRGELVEKDQPLLTIYSPELLTTQNEFIDLLRTGDEACQKAGHAMSESTERLLNSAKQRLRLWNISDQQISEMEKSRKPQEYLVLHSPFRGVVQDIGVDQGRKVSMGDHLVDVADLSRVWVWADFYQEELPLLQKGLDLTITTSSYPGERLKGKIVVIDPFMNDAKRTARVRIDVDNPELKLRPDMYVDVELARNIGEGLVVPLNAVMLTGNRNVAFVGKGGGKLEPRIIELGRKYGDGYEVKSGLTVGERVVSSANFLIDAEAKVQGALKSW